MRRGVDILRNEGLDVLIHRGSMAFKNLLGMDYLGNFDKGYEKWRGIHETTLAQSDVESLLAGMETKPVFSIIVPVYNVDQIWLEAMVESVIAQQYPHWQLCIVDDGSSAAHIRPVLVAFSEKDSRINIDFNSRNVGIAETSNAALKLADGDYIGLLDHDDCLSDHALLENALAINQNPTLDLIYSDEDKINTQGIRATPFFKPDYSPELLHAHNYIGHFVVIRKTVMNKIGGFQSGFDGAQDYDVLLRACENTRAIHHIPKILYHWREIPGSTAASFDSKSYAWDAGQKALQQHFQHSNRAATVEQGIHPGTYRVSHDIQKSPKVSVIIPFRDQPELLERCLTSCFEYNSWPNLEVIGINNGSEIQSTFDVMKKWKSRDNRFQTIDYADEFNFSAIVNFGVEFASGEFVVLLNNDVEMTSYNWIETLLAHAQNPEVGAVGGKLFYPDRTIQHAGIVVGIDNGAGHPFRGFPEKHKGYFMRLDLTHNVSAVTAALLMVEKRKFLQVNGFDGNEFSVAYNDVDFCLKLIKAGYRNILDPNCQAIHRESSSRGYETSRKKQSRHDLEKQNLQTKWSDYFTPGDPCYNPNLSHIREDYSLEFNA